MKKTRLTITLLACVMAGVLFCAPSLLMGFTLLGPGIGVGADHGISSSSLSTVVRNGMVRAWPGTGVRCVGDNTLVEDLIVQECGVNGIELGQNASLHSCIASFNTGTGAIAGVDSASIL